MNDKFVNRLLDLDGTTVLEDIDNKDAHLFGEAHPAEGAIEKINSWYENGDYIVFFTSRLEEHRTVTEGWLNKHGFKYHGIIFGKPRGGNYFWVDNLEGQYVQYKGNWAEIN